MRRSLPLLATGLALLVGMKAAPAAADGLVKVTPPRIPQGGAGLYQELLHQVVRANVISFNCKGFEITDGEWSLLLATSDILAARLGLSPEALETDYYGPAFALLEDPASCRTHGPQVAEVMELIEGFGGRPSSD